MNQRTREASPTRPRSLWAGAFVGARPPDGYGKYKAFFSPDRKRALVFDPGVEFAMMRNSFLFRLVGKDRKLLQAFEGLESAVQYAWWTPDSRVVGVALLEDRAALLLVDVAKSRFALVTFCSYNQEARLSARSVTISENPREFTAIFGDGFEVPTPTTFPFAKLAWLPVPKGPWDLRKALPAAPAAAWRPTKEMLAAARKNGFTVARSR